MPKIYIEVGDNQCTYGNIWKEAEKQVVKEVLESRRWNQSATARALGISRGCLRMKLREYYGDTYFKNSGDKNAN